MTENAAAPAPVAEEVTPTVTPETPDTTPEPSERDAMSAIYDKLNSDDGDDTPPEKPAEAAETPAEPVQEVKPPTDLPGAVKERWGDMSEEVREAVTTAHRDISQKNAEMGRKFNSVQPILQAFEEVAQQMPQIRSLPAEQVSKEVADMARFSMQFQQKPLETVIGFINKHNLGNQLRAAFAGPQGQNEAALAREVAQLKQQLQQAADPQNLRQQFQAFQNETAINSDIDQFAAQAEHWAEVEQDIVPLIPVAQNALPEGASNADVLEKAYNMAIFARGLTATAQPGGDEPPARVDPAKAEKVKKATSVNVTGKPTGSPRNLTEREQMAQKYDQLMNS